MAESSSKKMSTVRLKTCPESKHIFNQNPIFVFQRLISTTIPGMCNAREVVGEKIKRHMSTRHLFDKEKDLSMRNLVEKGKVLSTRHLVDEQKDLSIMRDHVEEEKEMIKRRKQLILV